MIHEIRIEHPPVEESPHFLARIDPRDLVPAARCYNPSICRHQGRLIMAYRAESYTAVSKVAYATLDSELRVTGCGFIGLPNEVGDCHWEDPRLVEIGGRLHLMAAYIRLQIPPVCQQKLFILDSATFQPVDEILMSFGKLGGIEKNWTPFETQGGRAAFVYSQRPRMIVEVQSKAGHDAAAVPIGPAGTSLSGRTPPVRHGAHYLEFVGGWVRIPVRTGRYWFGAQLFEADPPHRVVKYTPEPLCWGSEASPTIHSPRPQAGHPCCVFPAGAVIEGEDVIVSVGVNDSYCCLMRFNLAELVGKMVNA
jgi:hypothetical protein